MTEEQHKAILDQIEGSTSRIGKSFSAQYELIAVFNNNLLITNMYLRRMSRFTGAILSIMLILLLLRFGFRVI